MRYSCKNMSSFCGLSQPRSDRAPLRDVQNDPHLIFKHASMHERVPKKLEDVSVESSSNLKKCDVQTVISTTEVSSDGQTVEATDEHKDITLKSVECVEVIAENKPVMSNESILIRQLYMENNHPIGPNETNDVEGRMDNQINEEHVDHPYCNVSRFTGLDSSMLYQREEISTCEPGSVTFKSLMCLGGDVQITDCSVITDESTLSLDIAAGNHSKGLNTSACISELYPGALAVIGQPMDHTYCNLKVHVSSFEDSSQGADVAIFHTSQPTGEHMVHTLCETKNTTSLNNNGLAGLSEGCHDLSSSQEEITFKSLGCFEFEKEIADLFKMSETSLYMENSVEEQSQCCLNDISENNTQNFAVLTPGSIHVDHAYCHVKENVALLNKEAQVLHSSEIALKVATRNSLMCHEMEMETSESVASQQRSQALSALNHGENKKEISHTVQLNVTEELLNDTHNVPNGDNLVMVGKVEEEHLDHHVLSYPQGVFSENVDLETCNVKDNALVLKEEAIFPETEVMQLYDQTRKVVSVQQDHTSAFALTGPCTPKMSTVNRSILYDHTMSHLWPKLPESPMPVPQLNSTTLADAFSHTPVPAEPPQAKYNEVQVASGQSEKVLNDPHVVSNAPLQEQLRQMAELLMLASGKVVVPSPVPMNQRSTLVGTSPVEKHSVCVWRTPIERVERSINTSAAMEIVKEVHVSDASTLTDSLLWNLTSGNLENLSRSELEQRLTSTLIMVEVLSQQLTAARVYVPSKETSLSDLRDKLIQTDHTELRRNGTYKDLYVAAQERIQSLEHDQEVLQSLNNGIQAIRVGMNLVKSCTEEAILTMKQTGDIVNVDQETLSRQVSQMKSLYGRYREMLQRMEQKIKDLRQHMDKALQEKEAAFSVTQQLREYHAAQVAELEQSVGSHQELMSSLTLAYPCLADLHKAYMKSISAANIHLRRKHEDHMSLLEELRKAQELIQKTSPIFHQLHQRAVTAMEQSKQHLAMKVRAVQDRDMMEKELEQVKLSFQDALEQIADLNMQQTIMTSEMSVLREQLNEAEEERSQLQRTNTELSATVSSTLASYAFLEETLASETSKLQQEMHASHQASERVNGLEAELESSRKRMEDFEAVLSQRETLIKELHNEAEIHHHQLIQLAQLQTELSGAKEMSEFLQAENELAREQMEESERLLRCHLQGLRERNVECEDLRLALAQLRLEKESLQEELDSTRDKARHMLLEQGEKMAQASNDVMLLNHRVCCLTNSLKECQNNKGSESSDNILHSHRHPSSSFVDSIMLAMKTQESGTEFPLGSEERELQPDGIGSESSAFTRIPPTAYTEVKEERQLCVLELLSDLDKTISDLQFTIDQLRVQKDTEHQTLQQTICGLQEVLQDESQKHVLEVSQLKQNVDKLQTRVEKDTVVLQQKAQDEKNLRKLCSELEEKMEAAHKYRAENSELRREVAHLRQLEQQAQVEAQVLREELKRTGFQSAASTTELDERIKLLREVEKLKANLMETEENCARVLERAKRHQRVHAVNQSKLERELHLLDDMIETVRRTLSSIPDLVKSYPELQKLAEYLG